MKFQIVLIREFHDFSCKDPCQISKIRCNEDKKLKEIEIIVKKSTKIWSKMNFKEACKKIRDRDKCYFMAI